MVTDIFPDISSATSRRDGHVVCSPMGYMNPCEVNIGATKPESRSDVLGEWDLAGPSCVSFAVVAIDPDDC